MIRPMTLLLKYEGYPPAVLGALLLHGLLFYFLIGSGLLTAEYVEIEDPVYIRASVVAADPQRLRRLELVDQQRRSDQRAEQARQEEAARVDEAQRAQARENQARETREASERAELARQQARQEQATADRLKQEAVARDAEAARIRNEALAQEQARVQAAREAQASAARQAEQTAQDAQNEQAYSVYIHDAVANNWSVPPSARNGMVVALELKLVPTGEVVSYRILQESGDAAFDRSALQAVGRAGRFPELQEMPNRLFEQKFRTITLLFRPEDLLR